MNEGAELQGLRNVGVINLITHHLLEGVGSYFSSGGCI
jgi:hypothetical protein